MAALHRSHLFLSGLSLGSGLDYVSTAFYANDIIEHHVSRASCPQTLGRKVNGIYSYSIRAGMAV